jgi:CTD kinase subunit alpha
MLELFTTRPIFQGNDEIHQLEVIYNVCGTPSEDAWPRLKELPWYELVKPKVTVPCRFRESFSKCVRPTS